MVVGIKTLEDLLLLLAVEFVCGGGVRMVVAGGAELRRRQGLNEDFVFFGTEEKEERDGRLVGLKPG